MATNLNLPEGFELEEPINQNNQLPAGFEFEDNGQMPQGFEIQQPENTGFLQSAGQFAMGLPQALGNKFVGATQTISDIIAPESQFSQNLASQVAKLKERQSQLPTAERAGIIAGEIGTDIALSPTKGSLAMQGLGAGTISALTTPQEEYGRQARAEEVAKGAATGAAFGKGFELAGKGLGAAFSGAKEGSKNIIQGLKARIPEEMAQTVQALKEKAGNTYKAVREAGVTINPVSANSIIDDVTNAVAETGKLNPILHNDTIGILQGLKDEIATGKTLDLEGLDQYRKLLSGVVKKNLVSNPEDAFKANVAIDKLDDIVENFNPKKLVQSGNPEAIKLLTQARKEWSTARKFEKISDIIEKADNDPNKIKSGFKRFIENKKNLRGFSNKEVDAIKKAATNTTLEGIYKQIGKFGLDIGTSKYSGSIALPAFAAGAVGVGKGMTAGGTVLAAGTVAKQAQKYLARGKAEEALRIIEGSANPSAIISRIPNRKMQEKLINQLLVKLSASGSVNLSNPANAQENMSEEEIRQIMEQQNQGSPNPYTQEELKKNPKIIKQRYYRE